MKSVTVWAGGIVLLVAAWGVTQIPAGQALTESSFVQSVDVGDRAVGRQMAVTVTDVAAAERISDEVGWAADGAWVVVDLSVEAVNTEEGAVLGLATLLIDGDTYRASERPVSLLGKALQVGVPKTGSVAFELPAGMRDGTAVIRFTVSDRDWRLDSVVEFTVDLGSLRWDDERELAPLAGGGV
ncbi:hypothetical protein [Microbacterium sp. 11MF]|uniref:hypothetical protein n=1 Tax=Microbacterium sp. 11MF TaxID=1169146 RepID=UPI00037B5CC6|nr:hypothetical protein [Microbacterium sp. 11MF]